MVRALINFGDALTHMAGVHVQGQPEGGFVFSYCLLRLEKQVAKVVKYKAQITSIDELQQALAQALPAGAQVHVNYDGVGILSKAFNPETTGGGEEELRAKLFPMAQGADFVAQLTPGMESNFFTIARKNSIESLSSIFSRYTWVSVSFGVFVVSDILSLVRDRQLLLPGYRVNVAGERIAAVETVSAQAGQLSEQEIGAERIPADVVLAYASACHLLVPASSCTVFGWERGVRAKADYGFKRNLFYAARLALFFVLGVLMVNAIVFFSIQSQVAELEAEKVMTSGRREAAGKKQKQLSGVRAVYDQTGWKTNQQPLYYADQLAQQVIADIQLTRLEIGVLDDALLRAEKRYTYSPSLIRVQGIAADPVVLHRWVAAVEGLAWVQETYAEKYQHDRKLGKGVFEFFIRMR